MSDHDTDKTLGPADPDPRSDDATLAPHFSEVAGGQIDRYKLLEPIGEGGFGTVGAAEQREPVKRRVALKIIKLGMDTRQVIARFEAERQALAMMDHPNIAKVFDAGATDAGRPYFVMELVKGVPIVEYCDRERLDTRERLDLFVKTCNAIQHAHQKGIIHRDIKPSNVLVTLHDGRPVPKVIDFGIAKATNQELTDKTIYTQHRQMIGTPAYMSPEQAEMSKLDIDTRSDIYSLGVLLYEMLTGTTPFTSEELNSAGLEGMMRMIREVEPHKPSTRLSSLGDTASRTAERRKADVQKLGLLLRGDLDWIVMRCLEKDRTRRYDTASGLAADIDRHLNDEPVSASPPSTVYRMRKFVKRNKGQVAAGGLVAALLVLGIVGTSWGMARAVREKDRADEQARLATAAAESERIAKQEAEQNAQRAIEQAERAEEAEAEATARAEELQLVADFQADQLGAIEPQVMGANLRRSLIDAAAEGDREAVEEALASINFTNIALITLEDNIFERTIEAIDTQFEDQPLVRAQLLQTVASTLRGLGLLDLATDSQTRALAIRRAELGDEHPDTLISISNMGRQLNEQGQKFEAEPFYREALEGGRRVLGDEHATTLTAINNLGQLLQSQGKFSEAEPYLSEALEIRRRVLGNDHPSTLRSVQNMGSLLYAQSKLSEAEPFYREALEGGRRLLGDEHPLTLIFIHNLGSLLQSQGNFSEAEPYLREAVERSRRALGDEHPDTLANINSLGNLLREQGKLPEAEPYLSEAIEIRRRVLGDDHPSTILSVSSLGLLLLDQGKLSEAEPYLSEALEGYRRVLGDDHPDTLTAINNLGVLLREQGELSEAESYLSEALEIRRRVLGDDHPSTLTSIGSLGTLLLEQGKLSEAETYYRETLESRRRLLGDDHPDTLISISNLGYLLETQGKLSEAETYYREAVETSRRVLGDEHPNTLIFTNNLGFALQKQGKLSEAEPYFREVLDLRRRMLGAEHPYTLKTVRVLGELLLTVERFAEAKALALECERLNRRVYGDAHSETADAINLLIDLYTAWHSAEPGAGHDATAAEWRAKLAEAQARGR